MTINVSTAKLYKAIEFLVLLAILGLLIWSQPWNSSSSSSETRKITVSGEATIEAEPDEYVFYPYYEVEGTDQDVLKASITETANTVVDRLKELGVPEKDIKLDASAYDRWYWADGEEGYIRASLTIKSKDKDLVQDVQDYLLTTDAKGQVTPNASFSEEKQKELDAQAVETASNDAKAKAEAQAKLFDAKLGKVITVNQGYESIFDYGYYGRGAELSVEDTATASSLPVLPGEDEYRQTVTVVYELK